MDLVVLDLEALVAAQTALRSCHDTTRSESARHGRLAGDAGNLLRQMAGDILSELNPTHLFDPFGPWEQWGMGRFTWECQNSHGVTSDTHRETQRIVSQVAEAHGDLGHVIASHASDAVACAGAATGKVGDLSAFCGPHNLLWFMEEPWVLVEHFREVETLLDKAAGEVVTFIRYLERLWQRAEDVINELRSASSHTNVTPPTHSPHAATKPVAGHVSDAERDGAIVATAMHYQSTPNFYTQSVQQVNGIPEREGGVVGGKLGFDCSGFVYRVYKDTGNANLIGNSSNIHDMYNSGRAIPITNTDAPLPHGVGVGSLIFFNDENGLAHVAIVTKPGATIADTEFTGATNPNAKYNKIETFRVRDWGKDETPVRFVTFDSP